MARFPHGDEAAWRKQVERELEGAEWSSLETKLREGITIAPLYTRAPIVHDTGARGSFRICMRHEVFDRAAIESDLAGGADAIWLAAPGISLSQVNLQRGTFLLELEASAALRLDGDDDRELYLGVDPLSASDEELGALLRRSAGRKGRALSVSTIRAHEAGANAVQEVAFALATGVSALRAAERAGGSIGDAAAQILFSFAVSKDVFLEISKLRAFRVAWKKVLRASGAEAETLVHAAASRRSLARRDPWVNMLRVTTEVFAAITGGADLVTPLAFDQALGIPDPLGRRIARNTPIILSEESKVSSVADPARGSHYVESLTDLLARAAWRELQSIEAEGGMEKALVSGRIERELEASWRALVAENAPIVGVTEFAIRGEKLLERAPSPNPPKHRDSELAEEAPS
jgi:methylmalonyl-CoA mutase